MVQSLWRTVQGSLKKLKIESLYGPIMPVLCLYPEELKAGTRTDTCVPTFTAARFTTAKGGSNPGVHQQTAASAAGGDRHRDCYNVTL